MRSILTSFPLIFENNSEEDEYFEGEEERTNRPNQQSGLSQFGIIPIILSYCKETNTTLANAMQESINLILYIASYIIIRNKEQEKLLKQKK